MLALSLYYVNANKGMRVFNTRWAYVERDLMRKYYDRENRILDWNGVVRSLKLAVSLYIPGMSEKLNPVLYVISIASMFSGFALGNAFPVYSVFAWGDPVVLVNSLFAQMIGFGISQVRMLSSMEKRDSVELRPV
jgi:hypothetical protein